MAGLPRSRRALVAREALVETLRVAYQTRVTGLAAEASFWGIFALPWLILGLVAGIAKLEPLFGAAALDSFEANTISLARRVLTPAAIEDLLKPLLESVMRGKGALSFFGLVVAVYAGSRLIGSLTDGMAIVYRQEGIRSFVRARVLSLGVYAAGLTGLIIVIPLVVLGPGVISRILPNMQSNTLSVLLVAGQWLLVLAAIVSIYHVATPHRTPWPADIPGALVAVALFSIFSYLLRWYFKLAVPGGLGVWRDLGAHRGHVVGLRDQPRPAARRRIQRRPCRAQRLVPGHWGARRCPHRA